MQGFGFDSEGRRSKLSRCSSRRGRVYLSPFINFPFGIIHVEDAVLVAVSLRILSGRLSRNASPIFNSLLIIMNYHTIPPGFINSNPRQPQISL